VTSTPIVARPAFVPRHESVARAVHRIKKSGKENPLVVCFTRRFPAEPPRARGSLGRFAL